MTATSCAAAETTIGRSVCASADGGANSAAATNSLASFAGLKGGSASSIIALAAPLVMGAIGKALGPSRTASGVQALL